MKTRFISKKLMMLTIILSVMGLSVQAFSQTLDSLLLEALRNNPRLRSITSLMQAYEHRSHAVGAYPAPSVKIEFLNIPTGSLNVWNDALSNNFGISQMIPLGGKLSAMVNAAEKEHAVVAQEYDLAKTRIFADIKMGYVKLWLIGTQRELQLEKSKLLKRLLSSARTMLIRNTILQGDILMIENELSLSETESFTLTRKSISEQQKLKATLGRERSSSDVVIYSLQDSLPKLDQTKLEEYLRTHNPELLKMSAMAAMNHAEANAISRELIPDLMVDAMFMRMPQGMLVTTSTLMATPDNMTAYGYNLMASITLPFLPWSRDAVDGKEEEFLAREQASLYEVESMGRTMSAQLGESINKAETSRELADRYRREILPSSMKAVESYLVAFENNQTGILNVIEAVKMLIMQKMDALMAHADFFMSLADVEMMIGGSIESSQ
jgi:outer membrane protein TolC